MTDDFDGLVDEIVCCTDLPTAEVRRRVWMEALELGWNVSRDMQSFHATPHIYGDNMAQVYSRGDGFIFETMVVAAKPSRQEWTRHALDRIRLYARQENIPLSALKILMMGDGSGSDSLFLAENSIPVNYFDIPGSKTFEFAVRRFRRRGVLGEKVKLITEYEGCFRELYDVVLSFEVLEHLPDPVSGVWDVSRCLKENGIALITESFGVLDQALPTHLKSNLRFCGKLPIMCHRAGLVLTWTNTQPPHKPLEFRKVRQSDLPGKFGVFRNRLLLTFFLSGSLLRAKLRAKRFLAKLGLTSGQAGGWSPRINE